MGDLLEQWRLASAVWALMGMKGFQTVAAMILVSELGEVHRFTHPRQVMAYLGLVPTENTSSETAPGPHHQMRQCPRPLVIGGVRPALRCPPKVSKELSRRHEAQPAQVRAISRARRTACIVATHVFLARRLARNKAIVAVARELCGFVWELLRTQPCYQEPTIHLQEFEGNSTNKQGGRHTTTLAQHPY